MVLKEETFSKAAGTGQPLKMTLVREHLTTDRNRG